MTKKAGADEGTKADEVVATEGFAVAGVHRKELPKRRTSKTYEFKVAGSKGYFTVGEFEDGAPAELFLNVSKQGSTLAGVMDALAISVSHGLQYGVPLKSYVKTFTNMAFAPAGLTDDKDIRTASSLVDYIFRRIGKDYLSFDDQLETGISHFEDQPANQAQLIADEVVEKIQEVVAEEKPAQAPQAAAPAPSAPAETPTKEDDTAPLCSFCGNITQRSGSCYVCTSCGMTTGCS
jgi:ribonucleoside-diphosphate reductase alpha chain